MAEFYQKYNSQFESQEKLAKKNEYTFHKIFETKITIPLNRLNAFMLECDATQYTVNQLQKDKKNNSCTIWLHHKIL